MTNTNNTTPKSYRIILSSIGILLIPAGFLCIGSGVGVIIKAGEAGQLKGTHCGTVMICSGIVLLIVSIIILKIYKRKCLFNK